MTTAQAAISLNAEQQRAARAPLGPTLVSAGPGSGKTRVAIARIEWLINSLSASPETILVFTFTNRAARELRQRLAEALPHDGGDRMFAGTFHSWGARFLRQHAYLAGRDPSFTICDQQESDDLIRTAVAEISGRESGSSQESRWLRQDISKWKSEGKTPEDELKRWRSVLNRPPNRMPRRARQALAYQRYQELTKRNNVVDFEDLITMPLRILQEHPGVLALTQESIEHIVVDEYQDTSRNQHLLVTTLASRDDGPDASIFIVGDTDQAIYSFRNADIRNLNNFTEEYPSAREIHLESNYRSSQEITDAAQSLIERNRMRLARVSHSIHGPIAPLEWRQHRNPEREAAFIAQQIHNLIRRDGVPPEQICVAYRTNPQSRPIEEALDKVHVLYHVAGNYEFYRRAEVRRYLDYLRITMNPLDAASLQRILNVPNRSIGPKAIEAIMEYAREQDIHLRTAINELATDNAGAVSKQAHKGLRRLVDLLAKLQEMREREQPVADMVRHLSDKAGLLEYFQRQRDGQQRVPNILELQQLADESKEKDLSAFLERSATNRERNSDQSGRVTVSSIHQTKGLEFDRVFVAGVEENILPHIRSMENPLDLEEERRLMYVAMTRARSHVCINWCETRPGNGKIRHTRRSRFTDEIPDEFWQSPLPQQSEAEMPEPQNSPNRDDYHDQD